MMPKHISVDGEVFNRDRQGRLPRRFPGAIGYGEWSFVLARMPASVAAAFHYFAPFLATLMASVWVGEVPNPAVFIGGALIVFGVVLVSRKALRTPKTAYRTENRATRL